MQEGGGGGHRTPTKTKTNSTDQPPLFTSLRNTALS